MLEIPKDVDIPNDILFEVSGIDLDDAEFISNFLDHFEVQYID